MRPTLIILNAALVAAYTSFETYHKRATPHTDVAKNAKAQASPAKDGNWHIGCDKNNKCSFYQGPALAAPTGAGFSQKPPARVTFDGCVSCDDGQNADLCNDCPWDDSAPSKKIRCVYMEHAITCLQMHELPNAPGSLIPRAVAAPARRNNTDEPAPAPPADAPRPPPVTNAPAPKCGFQDADCIDCIKEPNMCKECNWMFNCGQKKLCRHNGFREIMNTCHEVGEHC